MCKYQCTRFRFYCKPEIRLVSIGINSNVNSGYFIFGHQFNNSKLTSNNKMATMTTTTKRIISKRKRDIATDDAEEQLVKAMKVSEESEGDGDDRDTKEFNRYFTKRATDKPIFRDHESLKKFEEHTFRGDYRRMHQLHSLVEVSDIDTIRKNIGDMGREWNQIDNYLRMYTEDMRNFILDKSEDVKWCDDWKYRDHYSQAAYVFYNTYDVNHMMCNALFKIVDRLLKQKETVSSE